MIKFFNVKELALILHDMHNDNLKPEGKNPNAGKIANEPTTIEFISNNVRLLNAARERGLPVFHTGHYLRPDYLDVAPNGSSQRYGTLQDGTWGAEPIDELKPLPGEWVIRKGGGYSAFTGTPLEKWLRRLGVTTVIIGGAGTHAGVEATIRDTRELDFSCIVASDACSGVGTEHHTASMLILTFAQIGTTQEVVEAIRQAPA